MKGYKADIKRGKIEFVDDGLPLDYFSHQKPQKINLTRILNLLTKLNPDMIDSLGEVIQVGIEEGWVE